MTEETSQRISRAFIVLLLGVLALSAVLRHADLVAKLDFDGENTVDESDGFYALHQAQTGKTLYHDFAVPPHVLTPYMPLFYMVPATVAKWSQADAPGMMAIGRSFVYAAWVGIGVFIFLLARQGGCRPGLAALGSLLWLGGNMAVEDAISFRPDAAALFFSLAAIFVYQRRNDLRHALGAVMLLAVAFLHKQSVYAPLAVIVFEELLCGRRKRAAGLAAAWITVVGTIAILINESTHGAFYNNAFGSLAQFDGAWRVLLVLELSLLRGFAGFLGALLALWLVRGQQHRLLKCYFVMSCALAFATSWKFGSGINYYLEPFAVSCVLAAVFLQEASLKRPGPMLGWLAVATAISAEALVSTAAQFPGWRDEVLHHRASRERQAQQWDQCLACLGDLKEPVLIENGYLAWRRGATPVLMNASMFAALKRGGRFDDADLGRRMEDQEFTAVVATRPLESANGFRQFPPKWLDVIRRQYVLARTCPWGDAPSNCVYVYVPRSGGAGLSSAAK